MKTGMMKSKSLRTIVLAAAAMMGLAVAATPAFADLWCHKETHYYECGCASDGGVIVCKEEVEVCEGDGL